MSSAQQKWTSKILSLPKIFKQKAFKHIQSSAMKRQIFLARSKFQADQIKLNLPAVIVKHDINQPTKWQQNVS